MRIENTVGAGWIKPLFKVRKRFHVLFLVIVFVLSAGKTAHADNALHIEHLPKTIKQGDVCFVRASGPVSIKSIHGEFQGVRFPMTFEKNHGIYEGLLGIDMGSSPGVYELKVVAIDGDSRIYSSRLPLKVGKVEFGIQQLSLPPSMVDLDAETLERVNKEARHLEALFKGFRDERLWGGAFLRPVEGEFSAVFGLRRIINGQQRGPHTGVDIRAEEGTPVMASNTGVVALVDQLFFPGKSVVLDHGWGLYSMYFHLSEVLVSEGDKVRKGALLGRVGSTGRSTAPHLHWGIRINGARVDPLSLLNLTEQR